MSRVPESENNPSSQGVSLDALREAYARAMGLEAPETQAEQCVEAQQAGQAAESGESGANAPGPTAAADKAAAGDSLPPAPPAPSLPVPAHKDETDAHCPIGPLTVFEAMLFVGNRDNRPLSAEQAAQLLRGVEADEVPDLVRQLNARYAANGCPYEIVSTRGGYRMTLRADYDRLRRRFYGRRRQARLSQAAVDVLAIVAYKQPVTAEQVGRLRGKPSGHVLSQLVHRGLLQIERKGDGRHVAWYRTTERFLRVFGLDSLDDLPQSEEPL